MTNPWEWDEEYLLGLVDAKTTESIELEFKESASLQNTDRKKEEISKDVSAFANSAGGVLIYGMKEDRQTHVATGLDMGSDPSAITKEWLEQVINSNIHRRIDGIRIHQVELIKTSPGKVAYIVYVPQSTRAAHQAANNKYYKRYNFQSVPMEEYEVRDLYGRGETPDLRIQFILLNNKLTLTQDTTEYEPFELHIAITNDALEPANYAIINVYIDDGLSIVNARGLTVGEGLAFTFANTLHPVTMLSTNWGIPGRLPIFKEANFTITNSNDNILLKMPKKEQTTEQVYILGYEIKSPRMTAKLAFTILTKTEDTISLSGQYLNGEELGANYHEMGF